MLQVLAREVAECDGRVLWRERAVAGVDDPLQGGARDVGGNRAPDVAQDPFAHADVAYGLPPYEVPHRALSRFARVVVALARPQGRDVVAALAHVEHRAEA